MKAEEVTKLSWREDEQFVAVQGKLDELGDREMQASARVAELTKTIQEAEKSLVQCRAAALLSEPAEEEEGAIQSRLASLRCEIDNLKSQLQAIGIASTKLRGSVTVAEMEAKKRLAQLLIAPYRTAVNKLLVVIDEAVELNNQIQTIHAHGMKQQLTDAIVGTELLRMINMNAAWELLSFRNGQPSDALKYWRNHVTSIFNEG